MPRGNAACGLCAPWPLPLVARSGILSEYFTSTRSRTMGRSPCAVDEHGALDRARSPRRTAGLGVSLVGLALSGLAQAAVEAEHMEFGVLADGTPVPAVELSNANGVTVRIIALGAAI